MTLLCCHSCRVRFSKSASAYLTDCPECGLGLSRVTGAKSLMGFRLFDSLDIADTVPEALAISLPTEPEREWS